MPLFCIISDKDALDTLMDICVWYTNMYECVSHHILTFSPVCPYPVSEVSSKRTYNQNIKQIV